MLFGEFNSHGDAGWQLTDCLWMDAEGFTGSVCEVHQCTVLGHLHLGHHSVITDSMVLDLELDGQTDHADHCNAQIRMHNPKEPVPAVTGCVSLPARFRRPAALDYRLAAESASRGRASDAGDMGVRYTPDMLEMSKAVAALVAEGVITLK
jgi:hypothetical protein